MTTTMSPLDLKVELTAIANEMIEAADRAFTVHDHDDRLRAATQVRFVRTLATAGHLDLALAWIDAGRRMLKAWDAADMDAIYAERAGRR
jgi:hypothetical protein